MRRRILFRLAIGLASAVPMLVAVTAANAVVIDTSQGSYGVAMVPGTDGSLSQPALTQAGITPATGSGTCAVPSGAGLCWNGGPVMHSNETFALTWDPDHQYWAGTRDYVEQFLRNVAAASNSLTSPSPYQVTSQYQDQSGSAANNSVYGGGCIDYGESGGYVCQFGNSTGTGAGHDYPTTASCPVSGTNQFVLNSDGDLSGTATPNDICLTDTDIQGELQAMLAPLDGQFDKGFTPTVVILTPPGVEVCLNGSGTLCSANGASKAQFCSYHGQSDGVAYVVQPWTADTACDEPDLDPFPTTDASSQLAVDVGERLVSPLSQSQIAAITDPDMNGWFASNGDEIDDNVCQPVAKLDAVTIAGTSYDLSREFNNAGVLESDPNAPECANGVVLTPEFVVPGTVHSGDTVVFDGSTTASTLMVPNADYSWSFGDGSTASGPSVEHAYTHGGTYTVTLKVTDRGGNPATLSQTITVIGPAATQTTSNSASTSLRALLQLVPQGLRGMLRSGIDLRVLSNEPADAIATIMIPHDSAAKAHIKGKSAMVVIGRGTVAGITDGVDNVSLRLSRATTKKLSTLRRVTVTVRLMLIDAGHNHVAVDAAGLY